MSTTIKCTRKGCGQSFNPDENELPNCIFHPGSPLFHEGLKSWNCCSTAPAGRAVTSFDEFLAIPGCATGTHSSEKPIVVMPVVETSATTPAPSSSSGTTETYGTPVPPPPASSAAKSSVPTPTDVAKPVSTVYVEEQDDPTVPLTTGMKCKRKACGRTYDETIGRPRITDVEQCLYHPGAPLFRDASKGYTCCKRRVLDFDDFLAIKGCTVGKEHLFVGAKKEAVEEAVECRFDHYQTPTTVHVSIFGKGADKLKSSVKFEDAMMHVDLFLPNNKRFSKSFELFATIDPVASTFSILGTKCEIVLAKADGSSWPSITKLDQSVAGNFVPQLAFSSGGGSGTTGSRDMVLDPQNAARHLK